MRLGIYGGTFNPPHKGHTGAAMAFVNEMKLDKLLVIPTSVPPHKEYFSDVTEDDRMQMCKIAFKDIPKTEVSDLEIKRGGKSYTYLTIEELTHKERELYFLCGTDMILTIDEWMNYESIFENAIVCYIRRDNDSSNDVLIKEKVSEYKRDFNARIEEVKSCVTEISSSELRTRLLHHESVEEYIDHDVLKYINDKGLYR